MDNLSMFTVVCDALAAARRKPKGRPVAVALQPGDRERAVKSLREYRRRYELTQEDMAVLLGCNPQAVGRVERASPFAPTRVVAAALALDLKSLPDALGPERLGKIKRRQAMRAAAKALAVDRPQPEPVHVQRAVDDVEIPFE